METLIKKWHDHGVSVNYWYNELIKNPEISGDKLVIEFFRRYTPLEGIELYHINHDMGKPYCVSYDENGQAHYENHTKISHKMFVEKYGESIFSDLLLHDMDFHITKDRGELKRLWELSYSDHMFASAYAAIMANAESFGGIDSTSFKIKKKHLVRCLKI